ncbi:DUF6582 domain-containing protein [Rhodanobacter sp. A1T4]|jgi:cell division protein FtsX|uniref:DUF6582 domain-containing protein n=1 Tax=Rhodanobacter sp. A1T4 TaxID=2723087 RepID=UPI0031F31A64
MVKTPSPLRNSNNQHEKRNDMAKIDTEKRDDLTESHFAFPRQRKEPLEDAAHVRNAVARFNQVEGASAEEKDEAWKRIQAAAKKYGVELSEKSRHEMSKG